MNNETCFKTAVDETAARSMGESVRRGRKMNLTDTEPVVGPMIDVRIATTPDEYAQAFQIAYEVYFSKGFTPYSEHGMRATPYQFRPGAVVLVAHADGEPVATLTIYEGHGSDLPSASGWPMELGALDPRGLRVFELGALMVLPNGPHSGNPRVCLELFRYAWRYARLERGANAFCAFVQAHHRAFYIKMLGFKPFGPAKDYSWNGLQINAVAPLILDLDAAEDVYRQRFERFGDSTRNLHRFFVLERAGELRDQMQREVACLAKLDLSGLRREFAHLLPEEKYVRRPADVRELDWRQASERRLMAEAGASLACAVAF